MNVISSNQSNQHQGCQAQIHQAKATLSHAQHDQWQMISNSSSRSQEELIERTVYQSI